MNTIIVPTDFSDNADNALQYALMIARKTSARIYLLHAYHLPPSNTSSVKKIDHILKQDADDMLAQALAQVRSVPDNHAISVEVLSKKGNLISHLPFTINELQADLVVMGTQGASGLEEVLIGSNAAEAIEVAPCPVLTVPKAVQYHAPRTILYATDYLHNEVGYIAQLVNMAKVFNAQIHIAHVATDSQPDSEHTALLQKLAEEAKQKTGYTNIIYQNIRHADLEEGLEQTIKQTQTDMLCMVTRKRNLVEKLFDRSKTKRMAYHTHIPLLALHAK